MASFKLSISSWWSLAALLAYAAASAAWAHGAAERKQPAGAPAQTTAQPAGTHHDGAAHHHDHTQHGAGHHRHDYWETPPADYAARRSDRWSDPDAIRRGRELFTQNCAACHGASGRGDGPLAAGLVHAPADLTNHFHRAPGDGDGYLFWRVSEGGMVEPFRSMQSVMPAYKSTLTEEERWDVLAYVHAYFHLGLQQWEAKSDEAQAPKASSHEHRH